MNNENTINLVIVEFYHILVMGVYKLITLIDLKKSGICNLHICHNLYT
jgi:hypothetical protein